MNRLQVPIGPKHVACETGGLVCFEMEPGLTDLRWFLRQIDAAAATLPSEARTN